MEAEIIHCGQYKPYGDYFGVWDIQTDGESRDEVLKWVRENVYGKELPSNEEWLPNIRPGGPRHNDPDYYFRGRYFLEEIDGGYRYTVREPYYLWKTCELCGDL